ncbi:MAG: hypothetical protein K2Q03_00995 [Sphingobacteriaceae bacterium]|nr:hypothetical protein [Sphingobacteriaceae bacterium]
MKNIITVIFFLLSSFCFAQDKFEFMGIVKINGDDKSVITYRLVFTEKDGLISGHSITDLGGAHETKNSISGTYNKKTKDFFFKENAIIYTKSKYSDNQFCFINYTEKLNLKNVSKIDGDFKGLYANKTKCIDGKLTLVSAKKIEKLVNVVSKKIAKSNKINDATKASLNPNNILDSLKRNNLLKNQNLTLFTQNNELLFEIWDDQVEDGDVISLFQNDNLILNNYKVLNKRKQLKIQLNAKKTTFKIEALNEGEMKLNTTTIQINDEGKKIDLISILNAKESAFITIIRE